MNAPLHSSLSQGRALLALLPVVVIVTFGFLAVGLPLAALAVQVHDRLGFDATVVGLVIGLQSLAAILSRGAAGAYVDRAGPRAGLLSGLPVAALAGAAYMLSAAVADRHLALAVLAVGRVLLGVAESLFLTGAMLWGIARLGPLRTGFVMTWQGIAIYGAMALGAPAGLALEGAAGFAGVGAATILVPLLGMAVAAALPRVAPVRAARLPFRSVVGLIWRHGVVLALATVPFAALGSFVVLYFAARGWWGGGLALTGFGAGFILVRLLFSTLPDRIGGRPVALASLAAQVVGQLVLWLAPEPVPALAGAALTGCGVSLLFPAMGIEAVRRVPPANRGAAIGGFLAFFDLSVGLTGPLAGLLVAPFGFGSVFLAGAVAGAVAFGLVLRLRG